jgi:hypothetical protein
MRVSFVEEKLQLRANRRQTDPCRLRIILETVTSRHVLGQPSLSL